jgi:mobilome CxxCx(11)CxxC protein
MASLVADIDVVLSVVLLALGVLKLVLRWDARIRGHENGIAASIRTANQARNLMTDASATEDGARWFLNGASEPRAEDELIRDRSETERQTAYRLALREFEPNTTEATCPVCEASVWDYKPGSCGACGNTPVKQRAKS